MSDGQRREKPKFEPPPWEREAFDQLARRRAQAAAEAAENVTAPEAGAGATVALEAGAGATVALDAGGTGAEEAVSPVAPEAGAPDEAQVELMLRRLREEEESAPGTERIAQVAGVITAAIGVAMTIVGLIELVRSKSGLAVLGGVTVAVFGLGSLALGAWVWMGSKRVKGS